MSARLWKHRFLVFLAFGGWAARFPIRRTLGEGELRDRVVYLAGEVAQVALTLLL